VPGLRQRLVDVPRRLGIRRTVAVAPRWLLHPEYLVFVRDLRCSLPPRPDLGMLRWTLARETDVPCLRAINPGLGAAEIHRRWAEGQECLLFWFDSAPAYYYWDTVHPARLPYLGRTFRPRPQDFLVVEVFTHPAFRGRRIGAMSTIVGLHRARELGCTRWLALVAWWNTPALRHSRDRAGATVAGTVGYHRRFWGQADYFATGQVRLETAGTVEVAEGGLPEGWPPH
jgi:GNAT superfamily N-acetyltransferase